MKIYLIRHGETTGDVEDRYGGDYDDHLTEKGRQESKELAEKLKGKGIELIYHSPRARAVETAREVSNALGSHLQSVEDLRERNSYGILTGMTKKEALEAHLKEVEELKRDKLHHKVKNSEIYPHFKERTLNAFNRITSDSKHSTIAIITHGGPISCIVREVLRLGEIRKLDDCAIIELERKGDAFSVISTQGVELEK